MKTFFVQLFLSFWLAALGILVATTLLFPGSGPGPIENFRAAGRAASTRIVDDTLATMASGGCDAVQHMIGSFILIEPETRTPLCGEHLRDGEIALLQRAKDPHDFGINGHVDDFWVQVRPAVSTDGRHWLLLERTRYVTGSWFPPLPREALPASIIVTFILALFLTRPMRWLSRAFRSFAAGDLSVRLPVSRHWWSSIGGSDVRNLMLDFNNMADRINDLIDAQKLLVRDISHELRSPLARLRLALEMTRDETAEDLPSLDRMEEETERLNELIGQMLTLSLMESTKQLTQSDTFYVGEIVESLMPKMEFEAAGRGCSIHYSTHGTVPQTRGNRELLRRAIENIIRNAIRFTEAGTAVEVEVTAEQFVSLFGPAIRVLVSDRGPGVPEASLELIFRAFYRTDSARRDATGGFGVGLSIAERAVSLHGGRISARNREQGGLEIQILLPVANNAFPETARA